jgi:hypothetical protein
MNRLQEPNEENERATQEAQMQEAAYRRGFTQGMEEASRLVLQLAELGYKTTEIKRLLAVYDDHFIAPWRHGGDLDKFKVPPAFNIEECQEILSNTTGYDWIG